MAENNLPKTFCPLPWNHRYVNSAGQIRVCCLSDEGGNVLKDFWGRELHISNKNSLETAANSRLLRKTRQQMLKGEWPSFCGRCRAMEESGGVSHRQHKISVYAETIPSMIARTRPDGSADVPIQYFDFRLGNTCNLKCRMCGPWASTKWLDEWNKVQDSPWPLEPFRRMDWYKDETLWQEFAAQVSQMDRLHFGGGEPLLIPQMTQILHLCIQKGSAKRTTLSYNTNLTVLPDSAVELWPHFKEVELVVSIDGLESLNSYIRYPSRWDEFEQNIKRVGELSCRMKIKIFPAVTVQILNILELEKIFQWRERFQAFMAVPQLNMLYYPEHYCIRNLPADIKDRALGKVRAAKSKYSCNDFDVVEDLLMSPADPKQFEEFKRLTRTLDNLRNQSFNLNL